MRSLASTFLQRHGGQKPADPTHGKPCLLIASLQQSLVLELWIQRCVWVRTGRFIPQFIYKLVVCRITYGRVSSSADCCEPCSITSEPFNVLGLRPLIKVIITFLSFWWAGQTRVCPALLSADWQQQHFGAGLMREGKYFCEEHLCFCGKLRF